MTGTLYYKGPYTPGRILQKNTTWGRSNTKQSCRAHIRNDEEDIRQVASTLPGRNKKTKKMQGKMNVEQNNNFFIAGAAGAGATGA